MYMSQAFVASVQQMIQIRVREKSHRIQGDRWLEGNSARGN